LTLFPLRRSSDLPDHLSRFRVRATVFVTPELFSAVQDHSPTPIRDPHHVSPTRPQHYPGPGCTLRRTIPLSPRKLPLCVIPRADLLQSWFPASPSPPPRRAGGQLGWLASTASVWVLLRSVREY